MHELNEPNEGQVSPQIAAVTPEPAHRLQVSQTSILRVLQAQPCHLGDTPCAPVVLVHISLPVHLQCLTGEFCKKELVTQKQLNGEDLVI